VQFFFEEKKKNLGVTQKWVMTALKIERVKSKFFNF
jgi:hypothetical protein